MSTNGYATLERLQQIAARRFTEIEISGVKLRLASITERERSEYEASFLKPDGTPDPAKISSIKSKLIAICVVDGDGLRMLSVDDAAALDSRFANALYDRCVNHCSIDGEDDLAAKNLPAGSDSSTA